MESKLDCMKELAKLGITECFKDGKLKKINDGNFKHAELKKMYEDISGRA